MFFGADRFAQSSPDFVVVGLDRFFKRGSAREEDVHGIANDAADVETSSEFAETAAEGEGEAGGLVVLEIIEAGVGAGESNEFVEEEVERGSKALEELEFGFVHAEAEVAFAIGRGGGARGSSFFERRLRRRMGRGFWVVRRPYEIPRGHQASPFEVVV